MFCYLKKEKRKEKENLAYQLPNQGLKMKTSPTQHVLHFQNVPMIKKILIQFIEMWIRSNSQS